MYTFMFLFLYTFYINKELYIPKDLPKGVPKDFQEGPSKPVHPARSHGHGAALRQDTIMMDAAMMKIMTYSTVHAMMEVVFYIYIYIYIS